MLSEFKPEALTAARVAQLAALIFPTRLSSAVWIDLAKGTPDVGLAVKVFRRDRISADVLLGHATYGAVLGYDVAARGNVVVSLLGGVAHKWAGAMTHDWHPIIGFKIKF